ncbi:DUF1176 domain-containing protein [Chelatococcus sambhunathii]|uniref:DUF1176 domain-containing protein n=1 Tax=Chelatococcus sambhunathii TaxID=363953 RepID=A0ABU1DCB9_9HYPH|nr:DUF1176 domain-containing protein [Chelatococcus sambhunathii]MDR4305760.1 DUF1176 domain-containing protein [Chelatococcus sambhunathii]
MRIAAALAAACLFCAPAWASETRHESWTVACADGPARLDCRISTEEAAAGARIVRLVVSREATKAAPTRLNLTLLEPALAPPRPRLALAVDGGPPVRFASGSDLTTSPGPEPGSVTLGMSDAAAKRLLPFLRRGKSVEVTVTGDGGQPISATLDLPGFAAAAAEVDGRQNRKDPKDTIAELIGGGSPAALAGRLRDVARDAVPETLKKTMVARDCPVWDQAESSPSFLADESFAADLGDGRTLWAIVCAAGSYNADFALFVEDPSKAADRFESLLFATFVEAIGWTGADTLANVTYDPEKRELKAFDKGRGAGDCGQMGLWEWVGAAFRMIEYRAKDECDGVAKPESFPIVFRGEK